jgi:hypothetical protein
VDKALHGGLLVKIFAAVCGVILLAVIAFFAAADFAMPDRIQDREAVLVKEQILQTLAPLLSYDEDIPVQNIGNTVWDMVCFGSYEAKGIDVASAGWIAAQALRKEDRSAFSYKTADEYYTEFKGSSHGLVFISHASLLIVGTVFDAEIDMRGPQSCVQAQDAILKYEGNCCETASASKPRRAFVLAEKAAAAKEGE